MILKLKKKLNSINGDVNDRHVKQNVEESETLNIELGHQVTKLATKNNHLKQTYKQLYDSIKSLRVRSKEQCDDLINNVNIKSAEASDLNTRLQEKVLVITALKEQLDKLKGKAVITEAISLNLIEPKLLKVDVTQVVPNLHKNRMAHIDYIRHTQGEAATLRKIVESERLLSPLNTSLDYAYSTATSSVLNSVSNVNSDVKCALSNGCLLSDNHNTCVCADKNSVNARKKSKSVKTPVIRKIWKTTGKVFKTVGHIWKPTGRTFTLVGHMCPLTRIATPTLVSPREPIPIVNKTYKPVVTLVVQIVLWYLDSGCSKHMTGDRSQLVNFVQKFLGTVKFRNDHVAKIMGYGDYQIRNVTISRVYYVEGLGHNLFSVGQFCDSDLEVAFHQHTCFIRNLDGVDLLIGSWGNNLYTLSLQDMMASSPICLLSKASKTKSWLWHHRLSHLNFGAVNHLVRQGLVRGLPKLKFQKDHLCSACAMGKSTRKTHKPKSKDTNQEKLYLLHMDLYGPMRVESVNRKKYILVIMDDYSRFTWVKFLKSKDETLDFIIKFLKMIQTLYELLHNKLPDLSFFHVFGALCYLTNDSENFAMASEQCSSGPALNEITPGTISSGLMPTSSPSTSYVPPSRNDWDLLFQPMFDELLNPPPSGVNQAPEAIASIVEVIPPVNTDSTSSPSSIMVEQDAPSTSNSTTPTETQSSTIPQDVGDDNLDMEVAHMRSDSMFGIPILEINSEQSTTPASP
nr:hypothetical protein [Tanacetum cinerariifolium]